MSISIDIYDTAVQLGAREIDQCVPTWANGIDLDRLDQIDDNDCVLGQVFGFYSDGLDALFGVVGLGAGRDKKDERDRLADDHGFALSHLSSDLSYQTHYALLTDAWRREIRRRLAVTP